MTEKITKDSLTLADYPGDMVRVSCGRCDREGEYNRARLSKLLGETASLQDLLSDLARCPRARNAADPCGAHYPDLLDRNSNCGGGALHAVREQKKVAVG